MMSRHLISLLLFLSCLQVFSQPRQMTEDLPDNHVTSLAKDNKGYVWFGTENGLYRYNGHYFLCYYHEDREEGTLPSNRICSVLVDPNGLLWVATDSGLCTYDAANDSFNTVESVKIRTGLVQADSLTAYFGNGGISLIDGNGRMVLDRESAIYDLSLLVNDGHGNLWGGSVDNINIIRYDQQLNPLESITTGSSSPLLSFCTDPYGRLWIGRSNGLEMLKDSRVIKIPQSLKESILPGFGITMMASTPERMYLAVEDNGVFSYDYSDSTVVKGIQTVLRINKMSEVVCGMTDEAGDLWVGTRDRGFGNSCGKTELFSSNARIKAKTKTKYINCIACSPDGNYLWIGSRYKGVLGVDTKGNDWEWYDYSTNRRPYPLDLHGVMSLMYDSKGMLWINAEGKTMRLKPNKCYLSSFDVLSYNLDISVFCEDAYGTVWGGSDNGLHRWKGSQKGETLMLHSGITDVISLKDSTLLICDKEGGLFSIEPVSGRMTQFKLPRGCDTGRINCLHQSDDGTLWIGTESKGVFKVSDGGYSVYSRDDGLGADNISDIVSDRYGNIWISTVYGLSLISDQLENVATFFTDVKNLSPKSMVCCGDKICCGGSDGALYFDPEEVLGNISKSNPSIVFAGLKINNENVSPGKKSPLKKPLDDVSSITLKRSQYYFEVLLDVISYESAKTPRVFYRISDKGHQEVEWKECGNSLSIPFFRIPSGTYKLEVCATNEEGTINITPRELEIRLLRSPWVSWPAILLYIAVLAALIYSLVKFSTSRMEDRLRLENASKELENEKQLNNMKLNFFGNISHELRTFLSLIYSPVNMIPRARDEQERNRLIQTVNTNTGKLVELVDQLLSLSRMETSSMPLRISMHTIPELVSSYVSMFEDSARKKEIQLETILHTEPDTLYPVDVDKFGKILTNLLSNALKYTPEGGRIKVSVKPVDSPGPGLESAAGSSSYLRIDVTDDGIGMDPSEISDIFDRYTRLKNAGYVSQGNGIGLHYTRELVRMHKGAISATLNEDKGMTFSVVLPTDTSLFADVLAESGHDSHEVVEGLNIIEGMSDSYSDIGAGTDLDPDAENESQAGTEAEAGIKILLAEDNDQLRGFIASIFSPYYVVVTASDGEEALNLASDLLPDLIITDVMMPVMDGFELCSNVKSDNSLSHIPIIMLTAKTDEKDRMTGYDSGADVYLTKPFNAEILLKLTDNILKTRQRFRENLLTGNVADHEEKNTHLGDKDRQFVTTMIDFIEQNLSSGSMDILSLADQMCMSRSSLFRKVRSLTGMTPTAFVNNYRLNKAANMLRSGNYTISELYSELGFKSASYFTKAFKQQFGVTPSDFRGH